jgi:hypothetical protein
MKLAQPLKGVGLQAGEKGIHHGIIGDGARRWRRQVIGGPNSGRPDWAALTKPCSGNIDAPERVRPLAFGACRLAGNF